MTEQIFKALGDATRLRMVSLLMQRELCVCEIMDILNMSQSNVSRHLTILKNAGVLSGRKQAQWAYYQISETFPKELYQYLSRTLPQTSTYPEDMMRLGNCKAADHCEHTIVE
ncbi:MAG: metalloregulator ArsR/SmtB family transcription factor [Methanocalculaceae archaeon]|jgi:ArsR family transcriptional regulator|nr:metalloregulator ArsR/SmtB family transcription factor [Methanocalculaceae archaeon]